jgi:DNA polymerase-3 subunit alpha
MMGGGEAESAVGSDEELPEVPEWSESDMLAAEKELIGFFISGHPLARYEWILNKFALKKIKDIQTLSAGERTRVGGMVTEVRKLYTKKDQSPMATFRIEGLEGSISAIIFPRPFEEFGHLIIEDETVMFGGIMMEEDSGDLKFQVMEIFPLEQAASLFCDRVSIHLPEMGVNKQVLNSLKESVREFHGTTPLNLCIEFVEGQKVFLNTDHEFKVRPCAELEQQIEKLIGEGLVYIAAKSDALKNPPKPRKWERKKG